MKDIIEKIIETKTEDKPTKKIIKERFLYLKENIGILNTMVHDTHEYKTVIMDDELLTAEISLLGEAVERFEKLTGLKIEIK